MNVLYEVAFIKRPGSRASPLGQVHKPEMIDGTARSQIAITPTPGKM